MWKYFRVLRGTKVNSTNFFWQKYVNIKALVCTVGPIYNAPSNCSVILLLVLIQKRRVPIARYGYEYLVQYRRASNKVPKKYIMLTYFWENAKKIGLRKTARW